MKKTVLMSAAKKARIALAVMALCGMSFVGAQEAFAENVTIDANKNIICGDGAKGEKNPESAYDVKNAIILGNNAEVGGGPAIAIGKNAKTGKKFIAGADSGPVAIGSSAQALDDATTAVGGSSRALGEHSTAIGYLASADGAESVAIGRGWAEKERSMAIGHDSRAKYKNSIAIGYKSVTDAENTVSVGSVYEEFVSLSPDGTIVYKKIDNRRRITYVADGVDDHDAATVGQVKSMIAAGGGASFDGTKLNTAIQDADVAGGYKETTTNANADTKGTIAGAINSAYHAGRDYTDKQLTDKIGTVTGGTYIEAGKNVAENLGKLDTQVTANTAAIGKINTAIGDMSKLNVAGKDNLVDAVNKAYEAATSAGKNVGDLSTLDTTNKADLVGAVNEVNKKAEDAKTTATDALNKANTAQATATDALNKANNAQATATDALNKANNAQTTATDALNKANTNATNIGNLGELNTTNKGNLVGAVNEVNDKTKQNAEAIKNVNGRVDELGDKVDTLGGAVSKLDSKVNKVGAGAAALAALHPMEFDSDNKLSFAAGVGNYRGTNAAAIGAFYRPSEQVMFSISGNMGNGENMVNAGVSFALDRPSKTPTTKAALVKTVVAQNEQIAALNETVAEQNEKIARLEAMVEKLAAKQNA